jgi:hypothetical protein
VFNSTREAIDAERTCLRKGISCQAIPVPRDISAECGIALEVDPKDQPAVKSLFDERNISAFFHERKQVGK